MTNFSTIPTWPPIQAVTWPDGTGELTINGTSYPIHAATVTEARNEIIRRVTETASKLNRAVHVATTGPEGQFPIIVHPDGRIEPGNAQTAAAPARAAQPAELSKPETRSSAPAPAPAAAPLSPTTPVRVDRGVQQHAPQRAYDPTPGDPPADSPPSVVEGPQPSAANTLPWPAEPPARPQAAVGGEQPARADHSDLTSAVPSFNRPMRPGSPAQSDPAGKVGARRSFLTEDQTEEPATQGWRGFLTRLGLRPSPSANERSERADVRAVSQHWPGPRTIALVNGKGGASKTPSTILLSAVFARYGGAGVLAWDNNQTRGTLGWRTEQGPHEATLLDLLPQTERLLGTSAQSADLAHYVHHQTRDRFDVLRSQPMVLADQQRVEPSDVDAIWRVAAKYYRLILLDSGNDEADPMWLRMIDHTDQLVVVTTTRDDHAEAGALLLEALAQRDQRSARLAEQAVAIVSQADPRARPEEVRNIATGYQTLAREVVTIPHDPAIVDGLLRYGALRPATQRAWLAAGAAVARGLNGPRQ